MPSTARNEFAVIVLNVDRLKPINDSLGHQAGDELLLGVVAAIAEPSSVTTMCLARLAGDEFHDHRA